MEFSSTREFGTRIEKRARAWFCARYPGAICIQENYRIYRGEIDLIFELESRAGGGARFHVGSTRSHCELVFVEVRARLGGMETGIESVNYAKQKKILRAAKHFLMTYSGRATHLRFDILSWDGREWIHLANAQMVG